VLLTALLHDASEYVTHDLITPLKAAVGDVFKEVESRLMAAVHTRFGLPPLPTPEVKALIKKADWISAATEAVQLAGFEEREVRSVLGIKEKPLTNVTLVPLPVVEAQGRFLDAFRRAEAVWFRTRTPWPSPPWSTAMPWPFPAICWRWWPRPERTVPWLGNFCPMSGN
jgi:5'-deoxynucleotidase YfbR-like HD superfamily hydrolase